MPIVPVRAHCAHSPSWIRVTNGVTSAWSIASVANASWKVLWFEAGQDLELDRRARVAQRFGVRVRAVVVDELIGVAGDQQRRG